MKRLGLVFLSFLMHGLAVHAQTVEQTADGQVTVTAVISGLDEPWAIAFLPNGAKLVSERNGRLLYAHDGESIDVKGVPRVAALGQGGLLDVVAAKDFETTREIFLSYSKPMGGGAGTALAVARLSEDASQLQDLRDIFVMHAPSASTRHFGSRIVEARDGTLFLTIGERGVPQKAQDVSVHNGKVVRVTRMGDIPGDNPIKSGKWLPEIWSYGHRNPQGATLDAQGELWLVEHGAQGGDEINRVEAGANYGWPVISYGRNYNGSRIGTGTHAEGMEQPEFYWDPSIAPSGMMIYSGKLFTEWKGDIFIGSLKFDMISRLENTPSGVTEVERLFEGRFQRIRDIREAPDGSIWFLSVGDGAAYRITPG